MKFINQAIEYEANEVAFYYTKAEILEEKGELNESIKYYTIYENKRNDGLGYYGIAMIYLYTRNLDKAENIINKALLVNNSEGSFYSLKSVIYSEKRDYKKALNLAKKCYELSDTKLGKGLAATYIAINNTFLGNTDEVRKNVEIAYKSDPIGTMLIFATTGIELNYEFLLKDKNKELQRETNYYKHLYFRYFSSQCSVIDDIRDDKKNPKEIKSNMENIQELYQIKIFNLLPVFQFK